MATLILKEETPDRLVFVENPDRRKAGIFSFGKRQNSETTIILDLRYKRITRTKMIPKHPDEQTGLSFDQVQNITLYSADYSPMPDTQWPSAIAFILHDGSSLLFNSGRRDEMKLLADKIGSLTGLSMEEKFVSSPKEFPN